MLEHTQITHYHHAAYPILTVLCRTIAVFTVVTIKTDNSRGSWTSWAVCSAAVGFSACAWEQPVLDSRAGTQGGLWFRLIFFLVFWVGWWGCFSSNSPKAKHYKAILIYTAWPVYFSSWSNKPHPNCFIPGNAAPSAVLRLLGLWRFLLPSTIIPLWSCVTLEKQTNCIESPGSVHLSQVVCWTKALQGVPWWGETFLTGKGDGRSENWWTCMWKAPFTAVCCWEEQMINGVRLAQWLSDIHGNYSSVIVVLRSCAVSHAMLLCQEIYFNRSL